MNSRLLDHIGDTPLVEIRNLSPNPHVKILAKLESCNPGGSIKDRVAKAMLEAAEASGELTPDKTVIEATSGNTGIGLAMVCAVKGYRIKLLMSESASEERKMIMRAYGAEIELTPGHMGTDGAIELAYRLAREEPDKYVLMDQYNNPACVDAHYHGTGLEIWEQTGGRVTHAVCTLGTSGTAMGCAKRLHEMGPVHVAAVEPYAGHKIQGLKNMHESYPPGIYDKTMLDEILHVEDEEAFDLCRRLAREEGLFVGMSSGAAMGGALRLAATLDRGLIVVILPDGGERYLSTPLFASGQEQGVRVHDVASGMKALKASGGLGLYTMGPSLDNPDGLDSWRRVVLLDVMARYLETRDISHHAAAGLADMDDRTLAAARDSGRSRADYVEATRAAVMERAALLGIHESMAWPLAQAGRETAFELCRKLLGKGLAYEKLRSVYFDVFRDPRYGELGTQDMEKLSAGKTVDLDAYVKDNPLDFTLFKRATLQDLKLGDVLETEWGNVRPSWFLQHAVAALAGLPRIDVFVGSESHRFPHLENLRAIWSVAGREPQAWMVGKQVVADNEAGLAEAFGQAESPRAVRFWLLSGSYRKSLSASPESVGMWVRNWRKVQEGAGLLTLAVGNRGEGLSEEVEQAVFDLKAGFIEAMDNDVSLHHFWPVLFRFIKQVNGWCARGGLSGVVARQCLDQLLAVDEVLGILDRSHLPVVFSDLPEEVQLMVADRQKARAARDYAESDRLRDAIAAQGFRVEDAASGPRVFPID
ncbi:cysteine synthase [Salidesulfovibrio onnuriiensis]|uniref:cysteine synthase n=1 Tax=Salidesulfovibrio onnuriiensis TaxID=2583823 RepID=UPI0011C71095|nr:cysteine synthase [Salidesulfovibrio onnuriiensis]